jgi:hypothetical protein
MSIEKILEKQKILPVYIVHGSNWHCEVCLDEYNAEFSKDEQYWEAASKAIMAFKGHAPETGPFVVMDNDDDIPFLGHFTLVVSKGSPIAKGVFLESWMVLANQGFYQDSRMMQQAFEEESEIIRKQQQAALSKKKEKK